LTAFRMKRMFDVVKRKLPLVVVSGALLGFGLMRSVEAVLEKPFCTGDVWQIGEPTYAGGAQGYATPEEAARSGIRLLVPEDELKGVSQDAMDRLPLDSLSSDQGNYTFGGKVSDLVPNAERDSFTITVAETTAGGYLVVGGAVCLDGKS